MPIDIGAIIINAIPLWRSIASLRFAVHISVKHPCNAQSAFLSDDTHQDVSLFYHVASIRNQGLLCRLGNACYYPLSVHIEILQLLAYSLAAIDNHILEHFKLPIEQRMKACNMSSMKKAGKR